jgi:hypothetical protein
MRITDRDTGLKLSRVQVSLTPSELRWLIGLLQQHLATRKTCRRTTRANSSLACTGTNANDTFRQSNRQSLLEDDLAQQLERTARRRERGREVAVRFRLGELRRLGG